MAVRQHTLDDLGDRVVLDRRGGRGRLAELAYEFGRVRQHDPCVVWRRVGCVGLLLRLVLQPRLTSWARAMGSRPPGRTDQKKLRASASPRRTGSGRRHRGTAPSSATSSSRPVFMRDAMRRVRASASCRRLGPQNLLDGAPHEHQRGRARIWCGSDEGAARPTCKSSSSTKLASGATGLRTTALGSSETAPGPSTSMAPLCRRPRSPPTRTRAPVRLPVSSGRRSVQRALLLCIGGAGPLCRRHQSSPGVPTWILWTVLSSLSICAACDARTTLSHGGPQ